MFDFSHFLHGSRTAVMIMIGFKCLGSSCLDLGLASAPDCPASVTMSLPVLVSPRLGLSSRCTASAFASKILPRSLPLTRKNALTTTLVNNAGYITLKYKFLFLLMWLLLLLLFSIFLTNNFCSYFMFGSINKVNL